MPDPFFSIMRETLEETAHQLDVASLLATGLVYDNHFLHPELCFTGKISASLSEIRSGALTSYEFQDIIELLDMPNEIRDFVVENKMRIVPTGLGALLLYGRIAYGGDWCDEVVGRL